MIPTSGGKPVLCGLLVALMLAGSLVPAFAACAPGASRLGPATYIELGGSAPTGSVLADFDGDGILDVVTAVGHSNTNYFSGFVAFLHGHGDGTFSVPVTTAAGATPFCLAAGDFNGDGTLDLAVTNNTDSTVSILAGHGDGSFTAPVAFFAGRQPHHVIAADFNGDGVLDLAVGCASQFSVAVLLGHGSNGHGDGSFAAPVQYALHNYCTGVAAGDVDGDGILDLLATEYTDGTVAVLHGNGSGGVGDGTFATATHVASPGVVYDITLADLNHDGTLDMLVTKSGAGLELQFGRGDGTFGPLVHLADGAVGGSHVGDFDGDGILDIAYTQSTLNTAGVLSGQATGGFNNGQFALEIERTVGPFSALSASGDVNGDGVEDLVVGCYTSTRLGVLASACAPVVLSFALDHVRDVPNDQGGKVWLTWGAHRLDVQGGQVTGYRVWRRIPAAALAASTHLAGSLRMTQATGGAPVYWEAAASLPAQRLEAYGYTAATPQDSLPDSNPYTAFFVSATTGDPDVFFDTAVDSGYSVDNLAPAAPALVQGIGGAGSNALSWSPNTETDLGGYRVHRGTSRFFTPDAANLVGNPAGTSFNDPAGTAGFFYKVAAADVHGNVGPYVLVEPSGAAGVDMGFVSLDASPDAVTLTWYADVRVIAFAVLERLGDTGVWQAIASGVPDGGGQLVLRDAHVTMGETYRYRLTWSAADGAHASPATTVTIPGLALALRGAAPNPAHGARLAIRFTLTDGSAAALAVYDVTGRRVVDREVGTLGAGPHLIDLGGAHLPPGLYLARLTQHGESRTARMVLAP